MGLGGRSAYFYVNDINVFDLDRNGYSWVSVPAGTYKLTQKWPIDIMKGPIDITVDVKAGETRYFSFDTGSCGGPGICIEWTLRPVDNGRATLQIADKKFQSNFGLEKLKTMGLKK